MHSRNTHDMPQDSTNIIFIENWLALHPGRKVAQLMKLEVSDEHLAELLDIRPLIEARLPQPRHFDNPRPQGIIDKFNIDLSTSDHDFWKRPETD